MTARLLTDEQRFKDSEISHHVNPDGSVGYECQPGERPKYICYPLYDLYIPSHRIVWREELLDLMVKRHKKEDRSRLRELLRWLLDTEFPAAPPETEVVG